MARTDQGLERGAARGLAGSVRPPSRGALGKVRAVARQLLGLMTLRAATIVAKFALTLFIAHYLGLAPLGVYGIIVSATVLVPVLLGFGVSNNLGREAVRSRPDAIAVRLLQYFLVLIPAYVVLGGVISLTSSESATWIALLSLLMFLEHIQSDMFSLMTITGLPYGANLVFFIRAAGWSIVYMPLAVVDPGLRTLKAMGVFWLVGNLLATVLAVALTSKWRWWDAAKALPMAKMRFPHSHGSAALYINDVANTGFVYIDRYIIGFFLGPEMLGVYTFFWSIVNAMSNLVGTTLVQTGRGELLLVAHSSALHSFNGVLRALAVSSVKMTAALSILAIVLMYAAVPYVRRPELINNVGILYVLCGSLVFRMVYEVIGISFYVHNRDDITLYSGVSILVFSIVLNVILVPVAGIWGASIVLLASYAVGVVARGLIISRGFERGR